MKTQPRLQVYFYSPPMQAAHHSLLCRALQTRQFSRVRDILAASRAGISHDKGLSGVYASPGNKTQNISSALGTRASCNSSSLCTDSAKPRSPSCRLSRVRMFTVLLLCSLWPTTAGRGNNCKPRKAHPMGYFLLLCRNFRVLNL